jgi:hypothetical protein
MFSHTLMPNSKATEVLSKQRVCVRFHRHPEHSGHRTNIAMLCYAMLCYAMLCYAMLSYAMLCYAMLCYAMLCYAMLCYAMLCYATDIQQSICYPYVGMLCARRPRRRVPNTVAWVTCPACFWRNFRHVSYCAWDISESIFRMSNKSAEEKKPAVVDLKWAGHWRFVESHVIQPFRLRRLLRHMKRKC